MCANHRPESLPFSYLILKFKDCLGTKQVQTWTEYCRPDHRLEGCTEEAYHTLFEVLEEFKGEDQRC